MDEDDYAGPATVLVSGRDISVQVRLMVVHQPVDGQLHWSGRIAADPELHEVLAGSTTEVELVTPDGRATAKVGDVDPWGRYRVSGVGNPPFPLGSPPDDD